MNQQYKTPTVIVNLYMRVGIFLFVIPGFMLMLNMDEMTRTWVPFRFNYSGNETDTVIPTRYETLYAIDHIPRFWSDKQPTISEYSQLSTQYHQTFPYYLYLKYDETTQARSPITHLSANKITNSHRRTSTQTCSATKTLPSYPSQYFKRWITHRYSSRTHCCYVSLCNSHRISGRSCNMYCLKHKFIHNGYSKDNTESRL